MERRKEENIGNVLLRYLRQSQLETPLNEYRIIQAWTDVVGERVEKLTQSLRIYNQRQMRRSDLIRQLNNKVGANVISNISFS